MPFVDREIEMSALEAAYKNPIASLSVCISENLGYPTKKRKCGSDSLRVTGSYDDGADPILFQPFIWAQNRAD